ncbi:MAG: HlyD family efflux transporter periplasmic adaptor subunit [Planctomycetia bacterium]|nr:HlyD family efflux transporter periplasmic adaptor subunit [Planctomycetia bacterium]
MSTVDERAVEEARRQILAVVERIRALAQGDMQESEFFAALLGHVIEAMGAVGGIVWLVRDQGRVEAVSRQGVERAGIGTTDEAQAVHGKLVSALLGNPTGLVVPPRAGLTNADGTPAASNPTDLIVVAAPIDRGGNRAGLIEVFHEPNSPDVEHGYLMFVEQTAQPAGLFLERRQLATLDSQQATLSQVDRFSRAVHETLDPVATAFVLANEARRIIGCDRVSVLVRRGRKLRLEAVSGQESIERRASAVQAIEALVRVVAKAGDPLWHPDASQELPPQIEEELEAYVDESHATALAIIPLEKPRPTPVVKPGGVDAVAVAKAEAAPKVAPRPVGALVAEWFQSSSFDGGKRARVELVAEHGKVALANALAHTSLPLYPVLEFLGRSRVLTTARNLPKTIVATLAAAAATLALILVPADLRLEGKGTLEPVHHRDVFAGIDGVVESIGAGIEHGTDVKADQPLLSLRNIELDVALTDVLGRKAASEEQLVSTRRALLEDKKISADEKTRMAGRAAQLQREIESLEEQRKLYEAKKRDLVVRSPIDGVVVTWQVRDRLMLRPVEKGQVLLNVADKTGPWELEIHLPDDRLGHVNRAAAEARAAGRELVVDYILATDPGTRHTGTVKEIHEQAEVRGEQGNTVLVRITIDPARHEKEELGAGASVTARINCGPRPLGYVIFHDLLAFVQQHILFRLW